MTPQRPWHSLLRTKAPQAVQNRFQLFSESPDGAQVEKITQTHPIHLIQLAMYDANLYKKFKQSGTQLFWLDKWNATIKQYHCFSQAGANYFELLLGECYFNASLELPKGSVTQCDYLNKAAECGHFPSICQKSLQLVRQLETIKLPLTPASQKTAKQLVQQLFKLGDKASTYHLGIGHTLHAKIALTIAKIATTLRWRPLAKLSNEFTITHLTIARELARYSGDVLRNYCRQEYPEIKPSLLYSYGFTQAGFDSWTTFYKEASKLPYTNELRESAVHSGEQKAKSFINHYQLKPEIQVLRPCGAEALELTNFHNFG